MKCSTPNCTNVTFLGGQCIACTIVDDSKILRNSKCTEVDPFDKAYVEASSKMFKEPVPEFVEEIPMSEEAMAKALYNRQPHYEGGIDPITFGQDNLSSAEMNGFYKMNVIKYVARCDRKNGLEDLKKAQDYLNLLIDSYENTPKSSITEEEKLAIREASLCYTRVMEGKTAIVKRKDVLEELKDMLHDVNYTTSLCGDGKVYVELSK